MDIDKAKKTVANLVSYKMYPAGEVYRKLLEKGASKEVAEEAVSEFIKAGILDDCEYARLYIHDALVIGYKGMFRIKQELLKKGISSSVIERAISENEIDTEKQLESYVMLKYGESEFSSFSEIEKAKAHLMRRGYSIAEINRCFKKLKLG